jgi:hypothetical protein
MTRAALLVTAALFAAPCAFAQSVSNDQYQLRGVTAETTVVVGRAGDVGATAVASGNAASSANSDADVSFDNNQHMDGDANATTDATVWHADGTVAVNATALGNGVTSNAVNGDQDLRSEQLAHGDANADARFTGGDAGDAATSATASGNVAAVSQQYGQARVIADQESTGSISASVEADHCCVAGQAVAAGLASANNLTIGGETATILADTRQTATGESVAARVDLYAGYATDASGNATANANAVTIDNQWGYVNARVDQRASADVSADSYVTLGGDFLGFASAGAYGVGNQAIVANVGSDTVLDVTQNNAGDISANAALSGEGGETALASAAAYGNSVTGSLCAYCDDNVPTLTAHNDQTNSGDVRATSTVIAPRAGLVGATSTAIGNAATYQVTGPSSH